MRDVGSARPLEFFPRNDEGLASLEWVAIASAVILLGLGVNAAASNLGSNLLSSGNSNS